MQIDAETHQVNCPAASLYGVPPPIHAHYRSRATETASAASAPLGKTEVCQEPGAIAPRTVTADLALYLVQSCAKRTAGPIIGPSSWASTTGVAYSAFGSLPLLAPISSTFRPEAGLHRHPGNNEYINPFRCVKLPMVVCSAALVRPLGELPARITLGLVPVHHPLEACHASAEHWRRWRTRGGRSPCPVNMAADHPIQCRDWKGGSAVRRPHRFTIMLRHRSFLRSVASPEKRCRSRHAVAV